MSQSGGVFGDLTLGVADADLRTNTYRFVKRTTTGIALCGAGEKVVGVLQNKPNTGEGAAVRAVSGATTKLVAGAAVAIGDRLKADASGRGITTTTENDEVGAIALEAAAQANDIIEAQISLGNV